MNAALYPPVRGVPASDINGSMSHASPRWSVNGCTPASSALSDHMMIPQTVSNELPESHAANSAITVKSTIAFENIQKTKTYCHCGARP